MAVNYAEKYSALVDERFTEASFTAAATNNDYDFDGVNTVNVYEVNTAPMNDYVTSGANRYGTPEELGNGTQTMVLKQDRSFTYTIDRASQDDTMGTMQAGASLRRQIDEVVIPERDTYNISRMIEFCGYIDGTVITKANAYEKFLDARRNIRKNKAPVNGLISFVSTNFYKLIKLDTAFIKASDIAQNMLINGQVGKIDNIAIVEVPEEYLSGAEFIIVHPVATSAPQKLTEYKTNDNAPGISGTLVEGRLRYDAFVRKNKKGAIAVQMGKINGTSKAGTATNGDSIFTLTDIDADLLIRAGFELYYKAGAAQGDSSVGDDCSSWTKITNANKLDGKRLTSGILVKGLTSDQFLTFAFVDSDKKCIIPATKIKIVAKS